MQVLLVEDNPGDTRLIQEMLSEVPQLPFQAELAATLDAALRRLADNGIELVLLDLGLPDSQGLDTLLRVRDSAPDLPIVVLTGLDDAERALQALQSGAQDYLVKGQFQSASLARALRYAHERNQIEATLRQTVRELESRTEEMDSFTYSVSHDLKEPLRSLEAFSRFLIEDYGTKLDEQGRDYLNRLGTASTRLRDMIEELLTLTRLARRPHDLERVSVREVIEAIISVDQVAIEGKGGSVVIAGDLPDVLADLSRVEQVFGNLIVNGLKFNDSAEPRVTIGVQEREAGWVKFYIRDNGIGIAPAYHERIFEVFQRLHPRDAYEGSGAGLAIVRRAAEALGGRVWVESELGKGATFFVRLPLWQARPRSRVAAAARAERSRGAEVPSAHRLSR